MVFQRPNGTFFDVNIASASLNILAFVALVASWQDGIGALIVGLLIFILDEIRHPYPVINEVLPKEEGGDEPPTGNPA